jgi:hypothetical protein
MMNGRGVAQAQERSAATAARAEGAVVAAEEARLGKQWRLDEFGMAGWPSSRLISSRRGPISTTKKTQMLWSP